MLRGLSGDVSVCDSPDGLAEAAAARIQRASADACAARGSFSIALAGGSTPRTLYTLLSRPPFRAAIEWPLWDVFFGDERAVAPDDTSSNYRMARETLLDAVAIDPARVHRMPGDMPDLDLGADEYAIKLHGDLPEGPGHAPRLDCVLLGLGTNGHTASLFPHTHALEVQDRWVTRGRADEAPYDRLTLTYPAINAAALVMFLVAGEPKREALKATASGATPAARVRLVDGELLWLLDADAAGTD
ncbi:MAG: 6-phosphogluconolactonase [Candidatus Dormibacteraeota bacterium]|nr:6-phosphogluconolactonase [Candidatus Dormibacteraeota bacterium]